MPRGSRARNFGTVCFELVNLLYRGVSGASTEDECRGTGASICSRALTRDNVVTSVRIARRNGLRRVKITSNAAAQPLLQPDLTNASIFPAGELATRLIPERAKSEAYARLRTRVWMRFRTGQ